MSQRSLEEIKVVFEMGIRSYAKRHIGSADGVERVLKRTLEEIQRALQEGQVGDPGQLMELVATLTRRCTAEEAAGSEEQPLAAAQSGQLADEYRDQIQRLVSGLGEKQTEVLRSYFIERKSFPEICWELRIEEDQAREIVAQAKALLKGNG